MSARLLVAIGAGLASRGEHVTYVTVRKSPVETFIARRFARAPVHAVSARAGIARAVALSKVVKSTRAEAILVGNERDQLTAALAIGRHGGVVRRLAIGERFTPTWRTRLAASRSNCVLLGDQVGSDVHADTHVRASVAWPRPLAASSGDGDGRTTQAVSPSPLPSVLAIVAGDSSIPGEHAAGAAALRAAARLLTRHPSLRVLLLGETSAMQALRLHGASVGLAEHVAVASLDTLVEPGPFAASAVWVTAAGDLGAVSIVSAMMRRIPVIVPQGFDTESLVAPRITGFASDDSDPAGSVAALAHLLADPAAHSAMGAAAAARAERAHGWDALLRTIQAALARVADSAASRTSAA